MEINQMITLINEGYTNSNVDITATLFCITKYPNAEIYDAGDQIVAFRTWQGK